MNFKNTKTQISPCIVSKVRFALNMKNTSPNQLEIKKCSLEYWIRTIDSVCHLKGINDNDIKQKAIKKYNLLIK